MPDRGLYADLASSAFTHGESAFTAALRPACFARSDVVPDMVHL